MNEEIKKACMEYLALGISIIPIRPADRKPLGKRPRPQVGPLFALVQKLKISFPAHLSRAHITFDNIKIYFFVGWNDDWS